MRRINDFPRGLEHLIQGVKGYRATVCNGIVVLENVIHTRARTGKCLGVNISDLLE